MPDPWLPEPHVQIGDERIPVTEADRYKLELENMSDAIHGNGEPLLVRAEAAGQAHVVDALYRSSHSGTAVSLSDSNIVSIP